ncbi:dynein heavy chain 11, axonemal-like [Cyanistes caeruleus]|uniref:dynein heavy chain 11, axonemal-like n=1 Tax=Cyanistes caeruleus TaxID=156563 RepID=UPI000CDBA302|nr:dynein heavy chain 11, axonemal-like [Cyanistes caeruleus]
MKQCWKEVQLLKKSSIDDWTKTQWREINVEQMDVQLRRFAKAGSTAAYFCNLSVSVPPLPHSSHPLGCFGQAFNSRRPSQAFWGSSFVKGEDEVQSVAVDAVHDLSTEKILEEICQTWTAMEFSYQEQKRIEIPLLKSNEQLLETLVSDASDSEK